MGRPASIKKCPDCHQPGLKRNGTRNGKIRWRCTNCGSSPSRTRPDTTQLAQFTALLAWIKGKESQGEVDGTRTGRTARRQFSWCWNVPIPKPPVTGEIFDEVFLDGNYLPHHWCILLARSSTGPVTTWQWCNTETAAAYQAVLARMAPPVVVAIDGSGGCQKALKETWPDVTVQRCLVHVHRNNLRDLTSKPRTGAGKALLALSQTLLKVTNLDEAAIWSANLAAFYSEYDTWLKARTYAREDPEEALRRGKKPSGWWYTHERDRRVYYRFDRLFTNGQLFAFLTAIPGTILERTTNPVEAINAQITRLIGLHPGLSEDHMIAAVEWLLYSYTENPSTPAEILKNWRNNGEPTRRLIPKHKKQPTPQGPQKWGTAPTPEEGLWARKGWAGKWQP